MERLTRKSDSGMVWFIDREHESRYAEREPCDMDAHHARLAIAKLAEYEDLEEQGKLLKLPCAVGDTVYRFYTVNDETKIYEHRLTTLTNIVNIMEAGEIGKTVFLTQKEAEAALKELNF